MKRLWGCKLDGGIATPDTHQLLTPTHLPVITLSAVRPTLHKMFTMVPDIRMHNLALEPFWSRNLDELCERRSQGSDRGWDANSIASNDKRVAVWDWIQLEILNELVLRWAVSAARCEREKERLVAVAIHHQDGWQPANCFFWGADLEMQRKSNFPLHMQKDYWASKGNILLAFFQAEKLWPCSMGYLIIYNKLKLCVFF